VAKAKTQRTKQRRRYGPDDDVRADDLAPVVFRTAAVTGAALLVVSVGLGMAAGDGFRRFLQSYLVAFMYALSLGLGALFWVTLQHLVGARWSVAVRRIGELLASAMPLLAVLSLPVVVPVLLGNANLYPWVDAHLMESQHALAAKRPFLNPTFFAVRWAVYFGFWSVLGYWLLRRSLAQDAVGGAEPLSAVRKLSPPAMIAFAITTSFGAIDYLMTLDPTWFSTIFGVYYFAGCVIAIHCALALILMYLQQQGRLTRSVTVHHFHDIGKMMFAFTVFWAYIAFSQFMLIWYANIPEETAWYRVRTRGEWLGVGVALIFGHFVFPFLGLLSRHVKRNRLGLAFWAVWLLVLHYVDLYYLAMPTFSPGAVPWSLLDLTCVGGLLALLVAWVAHRARGCDLVPTRDPRLAESLAFENL
jgi:hypothetical protein